MSWGPWSPGVLDDVERRCQLRSLAALTAIFFGSNHTLVGELRDAEHGDVSASRRALELIDCLPTRVTPKNVVGVPGGNLAAAAPSMTAESTIEAMLFSLRSGLSCLGDPGDLDRLRRCDEAAIRQIAERLLKWKELNRPWLPAWSKEEVGKLIDVWRELK